MRIGAIAGAVASLMLYVSVSAMADDEEKVALKDVPQAVLGAVKSKFPAGELTAAEKETKEGNTTYEITLKNKGKNIDVALTSEGKIKQIETTLAIADLPKPVARAIEAKYPAATVKKAEEILEYKGEEETKKYEVVVATDDKKSLEVVLSPEGKILETEKDD
jgi:uncharacterized membrane protein YkoI